MQKRILFSERRCIARLRRIRDAFVHRGGRILPRRHARRQASVLDGRVGAAML